MKTPEEIKKGLECCYGDSVVRDCTQCPYASQVPTNTIFDVVTCDDDMESLGVDSFALIKQLEAKVPRWISVEDEYPDYKTAVLAYGQRWKSYNEKAEPFPMLHVAYTKGEDEGWFTYGEKSHVYPVTHWMPLPEPPEV